jgi:hypothetical protein
MGGIFGFGDKIQTTQNTQIGASEDAVLSTGGGASSREGNAVKADSSNVALGGIAVGGGASLQLGGAQIKGNNSGQITINEAAGAEAIAQKFADTIAQINDTASADKLAAQQLVSDALGKVTSLSESKQTEGISSLGKIALWGLALGLAALLVWKWK